MADINPPTPVVSAVKPGIKTTEFLISSIGGLFTIFLTFKGILPANIGAIIVASITGVYTIMRSIVKIYDPAYSAPDLPSGA